VNEAEFQKLYERYVRNESTPEEVKLFLQQVSDQDSDLKALFDDTWQGLEVYPGQYNLPNVKLPTRRPVPRFNRNQYIPVACILVVIFIAAVWLIRNNNHNRNQIAINQQTDIPPGKEGGILTLSDGRKIFLDEAQNGALANENGTVVVKQGGAIVYNATAGAGSAGAYNMITTPRARQLSLQLSDGSMVWLNAGSSIRFPAAFTGAVRNVEVTGEAYFEVAQKAGMPFTVSVADMKVEVLGTRFNINAYKDEDAVKTALLEGAVRVVQKDNIVKLIPGQQAIAAGDGKIAVKDRINMEEVIAWKNGYFHFESADLGTILRQFSQWYDIEIVYEGKVKERRFFALVKRSSTLNSVLKLLQDQDVPFRMEGRRLLIKGE
jgi:ferric-dicitrate binding protein FerR (iron transport regulator)